MSLLFVLSSSDRIAHHKTGYGVMLSALGLLLYGSRLITIYMIIVMTSVCDTETVVGIAARRPSVTLYILVTKAYWILDEKC